MAFIGRINVHTYHRQEPKYITVQACWDQLRHWKAAQGTVSSRVLNTECVDEAAGMKIVATSCRDGFRPKLEGLEANGAFVGHSFVSSRERSGPINFVDHVFQNFVANHARLEAQVLRVAQKLRRNLLLQVLLKLHYLYFDSSF